MPSHVLIYFGGQGDALSDELTTALARIADRGLPLSVKAVLRAMTKLSRAHACTRGP
jgi:hypothetical protein